MKTEEEIGEFYGKFYDRLVKFACNPDKKGDGLFLEEEDAKDLVSSVMLYHLEHPDKFLPSYVYNTIMQRRINVIRNSSRYKVMKERYRQHMLLDYNPTYDIADIDSERMSKILREEISNIEDSVKKEVVANHIINGDSVTDSVKNVKYAYKNMVYSFIKEMKEKYSSFYSEDK